MNNARAKMHVMQVRNLAWSNQCPSNIITKTELSLYVGNNKIIDGKINERLCSRNKMIIAIINDAQIISGDGELTRRGTKSKEISKMER